MNNNHHIRVVKKIQIKQKIVTILKRKKIAPSNNLRYLRLFQMQRMKEKNHETLDPKTWSKLTKPLKIRFLKKVRTMRIL